MWFKFFFFCVVKQKTVYELRISDWSSDVCSSDLVPIHFLLDLLCYHSAGDRPIGVDCVDLHYDSVLLVDTQRQTSQIQQSEDVWNFNYSDVDTHYHRN